MRVVVDSNRVMAALIGQTTTLDLLFSDNLDLYAPKIIVDEISRHKAHIIRKSGIRESAIDELLGIIFSKMNILGADKYQDAMSLALELVGKSDEADTPYVALALKLDCGIWTHDKHFFKQDKVPVYTNKTLASLLKVTKKR